MTIETVATASISAVLALLGKIVFDWLSGGKKRNGHGSGEQPVTYWLAHFQEIKNILRERDSLFVDIENRLDAIKDTLSRIEDSARQRGRGR